MNWPHQKLADLCEVFDDGDWIESKDQSAAGIRLIQTGNVGVGEFKGRDQKARFISDDTFRRLRCTEVIEGDCLISRLPDPVGRSCILPDVGERMITVVDCTIVRFTPRMLSAFFNYYSQSPEYAGCVAKLTTGATRERISRSNLGNIPVPVPEIAEQRRIVAVLNEVFAGIAAAMTNAQKNLTNTQALMDEELRSIFINEGRNWPRQKLGEISEVQSGGTPLRSNPHYWGGDVDWYSSGELNELHTTMPERTITSAGIENSNAKIFPRGSLLIGMYDTAALKMSLLDREAAFNQAIAGVRPRADINLAFVMYAINASKLELLELRRGVRQKNLSLGKVKDIVLPLPSLNEQNAVVDRIAKVEKLSGKLALLYRQKLQALTALKQSILHRAFAGELSSLSLNALSTAAE